MTREYRITVGNACLRMFSSRVAAVRYGREVVQKSDRNIGEVQLDWRYADHDWRGGDNEWVTVKSFGVPQNIL